MVLMSGMSVSRCLCVYDYDSTITNFHESCLISFASLMVGLRTCTCTCNQVLVLVLENFWSTCTRTCTCILGTCAISGNYCSYTETTATVSYGLLHNSNFAKAVLVY